MPKPKTRARAEAGRKGIAPDGIPRVGPSEVVKLSTGVEIRCWGIAWGAVRNLGNQMPRPMAPVIKLDSGHEEPNPDDPGYLRDLDEWESTRTDRINETTLLLCTEVVKVPTGLAGPNENTWDSALLEVGVTIRDGRRRYLDWLLLYAGPRMTDREMLFGVCNRMSMPSEAEVEQLAVMFPNREERGADPEPPAEGEA